MTHEERLAKHRKKSDRRRERMKSDPDYRKRMNEYQRKYAAAKRRNDPAHAEWIRERNRKYQSDPERRERKRAYDREYRQRPEVKQRNRESHTLALRLAKETNSPRYQKHLAKIRRSNWRRRINPETLLIDKQKEQERQRRKQSRSALVQLAKLAAKLEAKQ